MIEIIIGENDDNDGRPLTQDKPYLFATIFKPFWNMVVLLLELFGRNK